LLGIPLDDANILAAGLRDIWKRKSEAPRVLSFKDSPEERQKKLHAQWDELHRYEEIHRAAELERRQLELERELEMIRRDEIELEAIEKEHCDERRRSVAVVKENKNAAEVRRLVEKVKLEKQKAVEREMLKKGTLLDSFGTSLA
jgi:hypothetical protein